MGNGDYAKAEELLTDALAMAQASLGERHPTTIRIMQALAELHALQDRPDEAVAMLQQMDGAFLPWLLGEVYTTRSPSIRRRVVGSQSQFQEAALLIALRHPNSRAAQDAAASAILRYKGLQGEEEAALARLIRLRAENSDVRSLARDVEEKRSRLAVLYHAGLAAEVAGKQDDINRLKAQLEQAEFELSRQSGLFNRQLQEREASLAAIRAALRARSDKAALVEFRLYGDRELGAPETGKEPERWAAIVIDAERTQTIDLGAAADIDPLILAISSEDSYQDSDAASRQDREGSINPCATDEDSLACVQSGLYERLISPLHIAGYDTVFIVPDGALHLVPFHALRRNDGSYWISDTSQSVRRLQTGRDLAHAHEPPVRRGLVVFGGIDYDAQVSTSVSANQQVEDTVGPDRAVFEIAERLSRGQDGGVVPEAPAWRATDAMVSGSFRFGPLAQSALETEGIIKLFSNMRPREPVVSALGADGTEARLTSLPEPPRVLHLATHGFYRRGTHSAGRPMLLSGVALAGANADARTGGEDGILYAIEAQNLNLYGTELVVLSACETGQGVIEKGEGVYGLVRALRTAGAKHAVVALRKIPDDETSQFMQKFYNNWLNNEDLSPVLALEITKRQFVQEGTSLNWASFIAISADGAD
jgi:CHAT domain-containing protein